MKMPRDSLLDISLSVIICLVCISSTEALSWRIFVGREDCVYESIPRNQIDLLSSTFKKRNQPVPDKFNVAIEAGFLLSDMQGAETDKGAVDVILRSPEGQVAYSKQGLKDDSFVVNSRGSAVDWQLCFKLPNRNPASAHALTIELSYFTLNLRALVGTQHEKGKDPVPVESMEIPVADHLLNTDDVNKVLGGIRHISLQLNSLKAQQKYLKMRTERHLITIQSTYTRTLVWSAIEAFFIVAASLAQVVAVRYLFSTRFKGSKV